MLPEIPNIIEKLTLEDVPIEEFPLSWEDLDRLSSFHLFNCSMLKSLPSSIRKRKSLDKFTLQNCSKLKMLPKLPNNIESLTLEDVPIEEFPPSLEDLDRLRYLSLNNCSMLKSLPSNICKWKSLQDFKLENCPEIDKLPDDIGALESLKRFTAKGTAIGEVPSSISCLKSLTSLSMSRCEGVGGVGLSLPPNLLGLENLYELILSDCGITKLPDSLGDLTSLRTLFLKRNNFVSIPGSIINLSKLHSLDISYCERLRELPQLPTGTRTLNTSYCERLRELPQRLRELPQLPAGTRTLNTSYCEGLRDLPQLPAGIDIKAVNCTSLERSSYFAFQNDIFEKPSSLVAKFINCYNLDPDALNDVVKDTRLKIQGQAASVKNDTLLKTIYYKQVHVPKSVLLASIIYPESKIPEWFHYQSKGSFIDVKLPPLCLNCNFLCFALCVVAIPNPDRQCNHTDFQDHGSSIVTYYCNVKSKHGNGCVGYPSLSMPYCGPDYVKSNHVIIGFGYYFFREFYDNEFSFQFNVRNNYTNDDKEHLKVEMCGVHLMSGLHLETSN